MRTAQDAMLDLPKHLFPSIQANIHAGKLLSAEENGVSYFKIQVNVL